jgi:F0F1-type ATP synthase assembly protein I
VTGILTYVLPSLFFILFVFSYLKKRSLQKKDGFDTESEDITFTAAEQIEIN